MSNLTTSWISFGPMQVDWEIRVDFENLRKDRLARGFTSAAATNRIFGYAARRTLFIAGFDFHLLLAYK